MEIPLRFARNPGADSSRHAVVGAVVVAAESQGRLTQSPAGGSVNGPYLLQTKPAAASDRASKTASTPQCLILFPFVFRRGNNAIFNGIRMHRDTNPVKDRHAETESRAGNRSDSCEAQHNQSTDGE